MSLPRSSTLAVTGHVEADSLVQTNELALLIAMLLDQQISIELAFKGPFRLEERIGAITVERILEHSEQDLIDMFVIKPALHRFPAVMARRTIALCEYLRDVWQADAQALWADQPDAQQLHDRIRALPGFGDEKTKILIAVLAKRMSVAPAGWQERAGAFADDQPRSVADIDSPAALAAVRAWKTDQRAAGKSKQD